VWSCNALRGIDNRKAGDFGRARAPPCVYKERQKLPLPPTIQTSLNYFPLFPPLRRPLAPDCCVCVIGTNERVCGLSIDGFWEGLRCSKDENTRNHKGRKIEMTLTLTKKISNTMVL